LHEEGSDSFGSRCVEAVYMPRSSGSKYTDCPDRRHL
jgi:hypothetical protein